MELSGTRSNIQNCVSTANQPILDKSFRDRRKHLPDNLAVLLPKRRVAIPSVNNRLVGLHQRQYSYPKIGDASGKRDSSGGGTETP